LKKGIGVEDIVGAAKRGTLAKPDVGGGLAIDAVSGGATLVLDVPGGGAIGADCGTATVGAATCPGGFCTGGVKKGTPWLD